MKSWCLVWRDAFMPVSSTIELKELRDALRNALRVDDPPIAYHWLLNWFDDTLRDETPPDDTSRNELLAEVEQELLKREFLSVPLTSDVIALLHVDVHPGILADALQEAGMLDTYDTLVALRQGNTYTVGILRNFLNELRTISMPSCRS